MSAHAAVDPTVRAVPGGPAGPRDAGVEPPDERLRRRAALGLLASAQFVVMLDTSIVNVALPSIQQDLRLSPAGVAWVVNAYVLAFGGLLLVAGRAADVVGRRRMFVAGSALFTVGTLVAGLAGDEAALVAGRVVQGAGAAALSPAAMSLLLVLFPGAARARAMSVWGAASTLGGATGVVAGGLLAGVLGWSWVFFATVPVTLVGILAAGHLLAGPREGTTAGGGAGGGAGASAGARGGAGAGVGAGGGAARRHVDPLGAVAVTGAVLALVHATLAVPGHGWRSPEVLTGAVVCVSLLGVFVRVERRVPDPLVPLGLFRSRAVSAGLVVAVLGGAARASTFVLIALYLQQAVGLAPQAAGLAMVPTSLAGFVVSMTLLPRVLRAVGPQRSMVAGLVVLALGHLWLARTPTQGLYAVDVLPALLLVAAGVALSFTPTTMVIAAGIPAERAGLASGLASTGTQVGAALGMAAFTAVATAATHSGSAAVDVVSVEGFAAAFVAAATVALTTAAVGAVLLRQRGSGRRGGDPAA